MDQLESSNATLSTLAESLDRSNMASVIENTPRQIEIALEQELPRLSQGRYEQLHVVGMGGSALPGDVVRGALGDVLKTRVEVVRHYFLPQVDPGSLILICSFSGNTEETVLALESLSERAGNIVVITSGGRLAEIAEEKSYPLIQIPIWHEPKGFQPRSAIGYFVTYMVRLLSSVDSNDEALAQLKEVPAFLRGLRLRSEAEDLARSLQDRIPAVYTDETHLMSIARIAKIKFNENSKRPAFFNSLPEANHNEMIGFSKSGLGKMGLIYLHDPDSHPRTRERFLVMKKVFAEEHLDHITFTEWAMPGKTKIQKTFASLMYADWCSYSLALLDGIDPSPVPLIETFKKTLSSFSEA